MDRMMRTQQTAGVTAAAARVMAPMSMSYSAFAVRQPSVQELGLGDGWQTVNSSCDHSDFTVAITNKRQPRRLGQRTT